MRLRPEHRDHVWSYDFVQARTHDGRAFRMLTVIDEFTRECLAVDVARRLTSEDVLECEIFDTFWEAKVLIERRRRDYNIVRPRSSVGYRSPTAEAAQACSFRGAKRACLI